ncbi:MAG: GGDEF domain-containing protein [Clostridia bacterium]|nr:GGDEF domain-containing protein [Clostridia bacterium]
MDVIGVSIISAEVITVITLLMILVTLIFRKEKKSTETKFFIALLIVVILGLITDEASYIIDLFPLNRTAIIIINAMSYPFTYFIFAFLGFYLIALIRERTNVSYIHAFALCTASLIGLIWETTSLISGKIFTVSEDGVFSFGPWARYENFFSYFCILYMLLLVVWGMSSMGKRLAISFSSYLLFPTLSIILCFIDPRLDYTYAGAGLSCIVLFIFVQIDIITRTKMQADIQARYANYDQMTGLKNRRAFSEEYKRLSEKLPEDICIIMADLNGLKETNDTYGHNAGDELIIGAAECLSSAFENNSSIYRIGGDEFCVITKGENEIAVRNLKKLEKLTAAWKGRYNERLSIAYGMESNHRRRDIAAMINEADRKMYENKRKYHSGFDKGTRLRMLHFD